MANKFGILKKGDDIMTNKFKIVNYFFIFIGLIDVLIFVKIFPPVYVELILFSLFILDVIMHIILYTKNKSDSSEKDGVLLKKLNANQSIYGMIFSFIFFFLVLATTPYTLKMSRILQQGFDSLVGFLLFSVMFFVYKFCDSIFDDGNQLFQSRVGGFYINPKHPIGKLVFLLLFLIPIYIILSSIFNGPIPINT